MAMMTKKQVKNLAAVLAVLGLYYIFFRKPKVVAPQQPPQPEKPTPSKPTQIVLDKRGIFTVVTKKDPLNIRKSPDKSSSIIGKIANDDIFEGARVKNMPWVAVYEKSDKSKVRGYVSADYVVSGMK